MTHPIEPLSGSQSLCRQLVDAIPAAAYTADLEGRIVLFNQAAADLWGRRPGPGDRCCDSWLMHRPDGTVMPSDECPMAVTLREGRAVAGAEVIVKRPDGSHRHAHAHTSPLRDERGELIGAVNMLVDITDRKGAERALADSETRFREVANSAPVMIWMSGIDTLRYWFNTRWLDFVGRSSEQERGEGWTQGVHPEDLERYLDMYRRAFAARTAFTMEYRLRRRDGEYRWIMAHGTPMHNAEGGFTGFIGTCADITERKHTEQELAEYRVQLERRVEERTRELTESHERLRMSERLAMMGTLAAGLGHDMGNLLVPVRVRLDSLAAQSLSSQAREDIETIRTSAEYLRRLATGLRMLALDPQRAGAGETTDITDWWTDASGVLKSVLPRGVALASKLPEGPCRVGLSKAALTQVVFNLIQNAGDAMRQRTSGAVTVEARAEDGGTALIVADDGPGMTPEVQRRCMEPYFSTKARAISTGLGLSLVYGLVKEAGGTVALESQFGHGTTFTIRLPDLRPAGAFGPAAAARAACVRVGDARVRSLIIGELRAMGYEPDDAASAPAIVVTDDAAGVPNVGVPVVLLADAHAHPHPHPQPHPHAAADTNVRAIGPRPGLAKIREALRSAAQGAQPI